MADEDTMTRRRLNRRSGNADRRRAASISSSVSATITTNRLLRKTAEFDNYRKRVERERRQQAEHAVTDLLLELLPVVDDFESRADRGRRRHFRVAIEKAWS
jgi:molecular chaperone GrpE